MRRGLHVVAVCAVWIFAACGSSDPNGPTTTEPDTGPRDNRAEYLSLPPLGELSATIKTTKGDMRLVLYADKTPVAVASFVTLAQRGFFDGLRFHRTIPGFTVESGCPLGTGTGGPGYVFDDEFHSELNHAAAGAVSMANTGPDTNGSRFFITLAPAPWLDGRHTVFGALADAEDRAVARAIAQGDAIRSVSIEGDAAALLRALNHRIEAWNADLSR